MSKAPECAIEEEGARGLLWLLFPHPGKIRSMPITGAGLLGRSEAANYHLDAPGVAPKHVQVDLAPRVDQPGTEVFVTDIANTTGIYISGMRAQRTVINDGDIMRVGGALAIMFAYDVVALEGTVIERDGLVRSPRSQKGYFLAFERMKSAPPNLRTVSIVGPAGVGKRSHAAWLCNAWGLAQVADALRTDTATVTDFSLAADDAVAAFLERSARIGAMIFRHAGALAPTQQSALAKGISRGVLPTFYFLTADHERTELVPELRDVLSGHVLDVPSIEERREEIPTLVRVFFERLGVHANRLSIELYESLTRAAWPGEHKEIFSVVRAVAEAHPDEPRLGPEHLTKPLTRRGGRSRSQAPPPSDQLEIERIRAALDAAGGSVAAAARLLHLSRQALYREAARLGLPIRRAKAAKET